MMAPEPQTAARIAAGEKTMPAWLVRPSRHPLPRDSERYLSRTLKALDHALDLARRPGMRVPAPVARFFYPAMPALGALMLLALCLPLSLEPVLVLAALGFPALAFQPLWRLKAVASLMLASGFFSLLLMLPALMQGHAWIAGFMLLRAVTASCWMGLLALTLGGHGVICALRSWHLPGSLLRVLELSLRSLTILTAKASEMVLALKLRSVGRNSRKFLPLGGLAGTLFLESQRLAEEQHQAMMLRGFGLSPQNKSRTRVRV